MGEITLSSQVYKMNCSFLKDRLLPWVEGNKLLCGEQNEFSPGRNCLDHNRRLPVSLILVKLTTLAIYISFGNNC